MPLLNQKQKILVVDDEKMIRWSLGEALRGWGFEPSEAATAAAALAAFEADPPAAVLLDINLPDGSGLEVLRKIRHQQPDAVVIMITANVLVDETIAALRGGAYDFIGKPINLEELQVAIRNGIEAGRLRKEVNLFRRERAQQFTFEQIIGESPANPSASTSIGTCPADCAPSTRYAIPCSRAICPIARIGCTLPVTFDACTTAINRVFARIAARISAGSTTHVTGSTGTCVY